jgi:hypothetical protein
MHHAFHLALAQAHAADLQRIAATSRLAHQSPAAAPKATPEGASRSRCVRAIQKLISPP